MRASRLLLLPSLFLVHIAAPDAARFDLQAARVESVDPPARSERFEVDARARAEAQPGQTRSLRFALELAPGCDPNHVFSNGFE